MHVWTGEVRVRHVDVAIDCGLVVNPGAATHQVEGSVVLGTSSTLREIIKFENGEVTNPTFADYAPITMAQYVYKGLKFDVVKSFEPIANVMTAPAVLAVSKKLPVTDLKSLIALAKQKPGSLTFGSTGTGGS